MLSNYRKMVSTKVLKELAVWTATVVLPGGFLILGAKLAAHPAVKALVKRTRRNKC